MIEDLMYHETGHKKWVWLEGFLEEKKLGTG